MIIMINVFYITMLYIKVQYAINSELQKRQLHNAVLNQKSLKQTVERKPTGGNVL